MQALISLRKISRSGRKLIFLAMLMNGLIGLTYNYIPFLFFRPTFYCSGQPCTEYEACQQPHLQFQSKYSFSSISMDLELYCERKHHEATLITLMLVGRLFGAIFSTWQADIAHSKGKVLMLYVVSNFVSVLAVLIIIISKSLLVMGAMLMLWCFTCEILNSFINSIPLLFFEGSLRMKILILQTCCWSLYGSIQPFLFIIIPNWRVTIFVGAVLPQLICGMYWYLSLNQLKIYSAIDSVNTILLERNTSMYVSTQVQEKVTFKHLIRSVHFRNICCYFVMYAGSYVATMSSLLSFGELAGNIYFNTTLIYFMEFVLVLMGGYISHLFGVRQTLQKIYLLLGISYLLYSFSPSALQFIIVIQGKLMTDITWILLGMYAYSIAPNNLYPLMVSIRCIFNLLVSALFPYAKYFMELIGSNVFIFSGLYQLLAAWAIYAIQELDLEKNQQSSKANH